MIHQEYKYDPVMLSYTTRIIHIDENVCFTFKELFYYKKKYRFLLKANMPGMDL
jgi:hypothetical protein